MFYHEGRCVTVEHCFDITDELPPPSERREKGPLFIGLAEYKPDDFGVLIIFSRECAGVFRDWSELRTGISNSPHGTQVWAEDVVFQLSRFDLTPDKYRDIVYRAVTLISAA